MNCADSPEPEEREVPVNWLIEASNKADKLKMHKSLSDQIIFIQNRLDKGLVTAREAYDKTMHVIFVHVTDEELTDDVTVADRAYDALKLEEVEKTSAIYHELNEKAKRIVDLPN